VSVAKKVMLRIYVININRAFNLKRVFKAMYLVEKHVGVNEK